MNVDTPSSIAGGHLPVDILGEVLWALPGKSLGLAMLLDREWNQAVKRYCSVRIMCMVIERLEARHVKRMSLWYWKTCGGVVMNSWSRRRRWGDVAILSS